MTQPPDDQDPAQVLLRRGIDASRQGRSDEAVAAWSEAVRVRAVHPQAHYLLGAELAHLQRYGDAVVHLTLAVDQAPELLPARVQLALLWLTLQSAAQAESAARPLLDLPADSGYHQVGRALTSLCQGNQGLAIESLRAVQSLGLDNAPLAADMDLLLKALVEQSGASSSARSGSGEVDHEVAISVYSGRRT